MGQLAVCKQEIERAREKRDQGREADGLIALGRLHLEKGQKRLALGVFGTAASLLHDLERKSGLAELYELMGQTCLDMGWTSKGCQYYEYACQLQRDLGAWPEVGHLYVQIGALEGRNLDACKLSFLHARVIFRTLSDKRWEGRSYIYQARTFWRRDYEEEALGFLRFAFDLLSQLPADEARSDLDAAQQLMDFFRSTYAKDEDFALALKASAPTYEEAKGEEETMRRKREEYHRDRSSDIEQLGLLRHDVGRTEVDAAPALLLIERYGYSKAAITSYEKTLPQLRSSHNRLAEAIIEGTITLLHILLRDRYASSETTIALYQEAGDDLLGLGRTYFNAAICDLLFGELHAVSALASLLYAEDLLVEAQANKGEIQRVRAQRAELKRKLGSTVYYRVRKEALEEYARLQEVSSCVSIYQAETIDEYIDVVETGTYVGEADNLLAALLQVLAMLIEEGSKTQPGQITLVAQWSLQFQVRGTTTGRSFASSTSCLDQADGETLFRVRLLTMRNRDDEDLFLWLPFNGMRRVKWSPDGQPTRRSQSSSGRRSLRKSVMPLLIE